MRLDEVTPSLEEVQGTTMPSKDLAAIHALANKSSQGVSDRVLVLLKYFYTTLAHN
jgi:hypothetical protein